MGPIFNEKVAKKWNLWVHKQYMIHYLLQKSQHLRLLFIEQYMNSNRVLPKRVKKKNAKRRRGFKMWIQTYTKTNLTMFLEMKWKYQGSGESTSRS